MLLNPLTNSTFVEPIDTSHFIEAANKLKPKLSTCHDEIFSKLLKEYSHIVKLPITRIINKSLNTSIFQEKLKIFKLVQIYKTSNKDELFNYRPISLLPGFSKLLENKLCKIKLYNLLIAIIFSMNSNTTSVHIIQPYTE